MITWSERKHAIAVKAAAGAALVAGLMLAQGPAEAQGKYNSPAPSAQSDDDEAPVRSWQDKDSSGRPLVPPSVAREDLPSSLIDSKGQAVERGELPPLMANDGSGLPHDVWHGLTLQSAGELVAALDLPARSPVLVSLWRRLLTAEAAPAGASEQEFRSLRVSALDRSGLIDEAAAVLAKSGGAAGDPAATFLTAKIEISLGNKDRGCASSKEPMGAKSLATKQMQAEAMLIVGYCAAQSGDTATAELKARVARELAVPGIEGPDLLDAAASGLKPELSTKGSLTPLDYRIAELPGTPATEIVLATATPGLLGVLARSPTTAPELRLAAGEKAAAAKLIEPQDLAALYRAPGAGGDAAVIERAALFKQAEGERTPLKKARFIRAFLDEAHRAGLYWVALEIMAKAANSLEPVAEIGWFAETGVETSLAAGDFERARRWASFGSSLPQATGSLDHWLALADIADPALAGSRTQHLAALERLAAGGRLDANLLHRLATTLDALDIQVPIPLWDLASRAPQPAGGHLPDTGVLTALAEASKSKDFARTVLLVMRTLGANGPENGHLIAIGDSIRALKRAGFEAEARRLALEGLFSAWPRATAF